MINQYLPACMDGTEKSTCWRLNWLEYRVSSQVKTSRRHAMKKLLLICLLGVLIGMAIGAAGMLFFYPYIFPPPTLNEQVSNAQSRPVIASGIFVHPDPSDPIHWGRGGVTLYSGNQVEVFLNPDFEVGPGPAYYVYLTDKTGIINNDHFKTSNHLEIGKLKSFTGSQVYPVPEDTQIENYKSVVIWCKTFGQLITSADLLVPQ